MVISNLTDFPVNEPIASNMVDISITLAIPLLLFSTRLREVFLHAQGAMRSFLLCIIAGIISCCLATLYFSNYVEESWKVGGMLAGIYTGGTPNMQAIGLALSAPKEFIILLNAADIITGGIYLILLTSFLPSLLSKILKPFTGNKSVSEMSQVENSNGLPNMSQRSSFPIWQEWSKAFSLSVLILGISAGTTILLFGNMKQVGFLILLLTSLSLAATLIPVVRKWAYTYELGEYFLLVFCVALGLQANFATMAAEGNTIVAFVASAMAGTILIHLFLAYLFKVDRDTFLITSTAALYGPAFVGQIASVINNRQLVFAGIALGLFGYAIGNYLGIGLAKFLEWIIV
ncbi:MAG: DUF819 family protein [Saprospiraceae bacterium]